MDRSSNIIKYSSFWANLFKSPQENSDLEDVISSMPPFQKFSAKYIKLLMKIVHNRSYVAGEFVFYKGDPGIGIYIIRDGVVKIVHEDDKNIEQTIALFGRGDFFGDMALTDDEIRSASAIASTECKIAVIFKPDLDEFIDMYPKKGVQILRGITQIIATRLRVLNKEYLNLLNNR